MALADLGIRQSLGDQAGDGVLGRGEAVPSGLRPAAGTPAAAADPGLAQRRLGARQITGGAEALVDADRLIDQRPAPVQHDPAARTCNQRPRSKARARAGATRPHRRPRQPAGSRHRLRPAPGSAAPRRSSRAGRCPPPARRLQSTHLWPGPGHPLPARAGRDLARRRVFQQRARQRAHLSHRCGQDRERLAGLAVGLDDEGPRPRSPARAIAGRPAGQIPVGGAGSFPGQAEVVAVEADQGQQAVTRTPRL